MQRRPRQRLHRAAHRRASRPMRNTSFPSRDSNYCATARVLPRPRAGSCRLLRAHGDFSRDGAAAGLGVARKPCLPGTGRGRGDLREPEIGWTTVPLARFAATLPSGAISENSPSNGFSQQRGHATVPLSTARAARTTPPARPRLRSYLLAGWPALSSPKQARRATQLETASTLSSQQHETGELETNEPPSVPLTWDGQ